MIEPAPALPGRLIVRGTGHGLLEYARRSLFEPMELGPVNWAQGKDGEPDAASGLRLLTLDMLKVVSSFWLAVTGTAGGLGPTTG